MQSQRIVEVQTSSHSREGTFTATKKRRKKKNKQKTLLTQTQRRKDTYQTRQYVRENELDKANESLAYTTKVRVRNPAVIRGWYFLLQKNMEL